VPMVRVLIGGALAEPQPAPPVATPLRLHRSPRELHDLVVAAKRSDTEAFEALVRATYGDVYGLAIRLVGNEHDAADVLQEAYLRAYRSLRKFRGDASFRTWMYRITANCAATLISRRHRTRHVELDEEMQIADCRPGRDPQAVASSGDDRKRLVCALAALPESLRIVVVLRDVYDLPHEAIATELGISQTAAKVRLHRARRKLRDQLLGEVETDGPTGISAHAV
jgi:RNA polymerase sigma-70 factor (ECF subfamily)